MAFALFGIFNAKAQTAAPQIKIEILSPSQLNGTAGDFVTVQAQITNLGTEPVSNITTYLSLVDNETKMPVDLEDWSVERGLFIGTIDAGQVLPLNWKVHFVKAGNYSLIIIGVVEGQDKPEVSTLTYFDVAPKHNLNPGMVLPVALGEPIVLLVIMLLVISRRKTDE
ncbi:MAG: hypothetical protein NTY09_09730 [bacterium]|nr:hypothetical protein [bacterium]